MYESIMQSHQGGVWLVPKLFCSMTTTSKNAARVIQIFNDKNYETNLVSDGMTPTISLRCGITSTDRNNWHNLNPLKNCGNYFKLLGTMFLHLETVCKCAKDNCCCFKGEVWSHQIFISFSFFSLLHFVWGYY